MNTLKIIGKAKKLILKNKFLGSIYGRLHLRRTEMIKKRILQQLKDLEAKSPDQIRMSLDNELQNILNYAYSTTTYYKNLLEDCGAQEGKNFKLKKIPFLNKKLVRENFDQLISKEFERGALRKKNTGGSTGQPLEFLCNTVAGMRNYGHHAYLYSLMGHSPQDLVISSGGFKLPEEDLAKNKFWVYTHKGNLFGDYRFSVLYLTQENIHIYVNKILELRPSILRGYPSFFDQVSRYILDNNIQIDFQVKGINLTAESCSPDQRGRIERAFSSMVYFEYGHNEISVYCYSKDNTYQYWSSPIYGYVEVLNDDGTETAIGEVGNIVATGFNNKAMPFIRYQTGDLGLLAYKNGGHVGFTKIFGRSQDFIISKSGDKVFLTALIFGQHLNAFARINKWQIVQKIIGEITISIIPESDFSKDDELEIKNSIESVCEVDVSFEYVKDIPLTSSGKHLFLKQELSI